MGNLHLLSLSLGFLFLLHGCLAQLELPQQQLWQQLQRQQQHRLRAKTQCRVQQLNAREPTYRYESEAGTTEFWEANGPEFECAGVEFTRHFIQPRGLLLPYYSNAPQLVYIVQGSGIQGHVFPGCAETYESEQSYSASHEEEGRQRPDRHQKLRRFRQGDILALPPGVTNWVYNDGETPIVSVALIDVANENNQLDLKFRKFFLAGNPQSAVSSQGESERGSRFGTHEGNQKNNMFGGFDPQLLSEMFNVDQELIRRLQGQEENRGVIVRAERMRLVVPEYGREEQEREREERRGGGGSYWGNGLEETFCTLKMRQNIDHPTRADFYNPRGGRLKTVNSQTLPILGYLRMNAERGVLYRNAVMAPRWSSNAHTVMYVTRGSARVQVVDSRGQSVFDEVVRQNQLLIIPQNFVCLKRASDEGFEWVSFKTNDNAITNQLAGRLSALRAMPDEVLMNAFGVSRENARSLKYNRDEATLFSPSSRSAGEYRAAAP